MTKPHIISESTSRPAREGGRATALATDALTGLPNRQAFFAMLDEALGTARRQGNLVALLIVDVDRFREINFAVGHRAADSVLDELAARIHHALRESDTLARIGGDEFAVILPKVLSKDHAMLAAHKILRTTENPFTVEERELTIRLSVGVAIYPDHSDTAESLFRNTEIAMYRAKSDRSGPVIFNKLEADAEAPPMIYEGELRRAIENNKLDLYFQPKRSLRTGLTCGAEALVRWPHPVHGLLPPTHFIPVAEQSDLIDSLTMWVLNAALRHCATWRNQGTGMNVSINLSTRNLQDPDLPDLVARSLETWRVPAKFLSLEITETAVMDDRYRVFDVLRRLNELGLQLAIDDFGSGYSSLDYLRKLPVGELKIDKVFVTTMQKDNDLIVRTIIQLAHNFGLVVTAEGVHDRATSDQLQHLKCDMAQGYYFSRPIPANEFTRSLPQLKSPPGAESVFPEL